MSGVLETDLFGPTTTTEQGTYVNPVLRIRTSYLKLETPVLDVLIGQQFTLFGWQPVFVSASVQYPGPPGEAAGREASCEQPNTTCTVTLNTRAPGGVVRSDREPW